MYIDLHIGLVNPHKLRLLDTFNLYLSITVGNKEVRN